jgi:hypothetical protein
VIALLSACTGPLCLLAPGHTHYRAHRGQRESNCHSLAADGNASNAHALMPSLFSSRLPACRRPSAVSSGAPSSQVSLISRRARTDVAIVPCPDLTALSQRPRRSFTAISTTLTRPTSAGVLPTSSCDLTYVLTYCCRQQVWFCSADARLLNSELLARMPPLRWPSSSS